MLLTKKLIIPISLVLPYARNIMQQVPYITANERCRSALFDIYFPVILKQPLKLSNVTHCLVLTL